MMNGCERERSLFSRPVNLPILATLLFATVSTAGAAEPPTSVQPDLFSTQVQPLVKQFCLGCHSTEKHKGDLDLERFGSLAQAHKDVKPWQSVLEMLESGEMPPKKKPQPTPEQRQQLIAWVHDFLDAEARARAGDPGFVPLRRLSNSEYDWTIRDLTGVDLRPAAEFPADGAAGEGFTNAAESLSDISPTLLNKYLLAAKEVAAHVVLLPDGFQFSPGKTRRDWSDESVARLRKFYSAYPSDGKLPLERYLTMTLRYRDAIASGQMTTDAAAAKEGLSPKYFGILWKTLTDATPSLPLDLIRAHWRSASERDARAIVADIEGWQKHLWSVVPVGSYRYGNIIRDVPNNSAVADTQAIRLAVNPASGQDEVTLYLSSRQILPGANGGSVVWSRPRFEGPDKPVLLLRDYPKFGPGFELNHAVLFADVAKYLASVAQAAGDKTRNPDEIAGQNGLNAELLKRWITLLNIERPDEHASESGFVPRAVSVVPFTLLDTHDEERWPSVKGWRSKEGELPVVLSNSSDVEEHIPGRASPHRVVMHPMPSEYVAAVWKSPIDGNVHVQGHVVHVHPGCGNGIAWWIEHRHADHAGVLVEGKIGPAQEARVPARNLNVAKGDLLIIAVDANGDHSCDLTEISLNITTPGNPAQEWDLSKDVADHILDANPHADRLGNKDVWSFVKGPTRPVIGGDPGGAVIASESMLGRWREAVIDPARQDEAAKLAIQAQKLLAGPAPTNAFAQDRLLYDRLISVDGVLLRGLDLSKLAGNANPATHFGLEASRFGTDSTGKPIDNASITAPAESVIEIRLPASLLKGRQFLVEAKINAAAPAGAVKMQALDKPPVDGAGLAESSAIVAARDGATLKQLLTGFDEFRKTFPLFVCFPNVIPVDEVVNLKMYHREDEPLIRLFLDDRQRQEIDHLWDQHLFISQQAIAENRYLPTFIGFVTQDQPKELLNYFMDARPEFQKRADECQQEMDAAVPLQMQALADFAARAWRRPLQEADKSELSSLYQSMRAKGMSHDETFRAVLARVLVAPAFLFRLEQSPPGKTAGPINDWELATRLSYFLWSSMPDAELRQSADAGRLHDPAVLAQQTQRMLSDDRVRALAVEFGTQWIHVRGFDEFKEKSEKIYPEFDDKLRAAIYEESILFFQDLFQRGEPVDRILDADYTYLNDTLAKHYGIPGVSGPQWRKVDGVKKYGRGGILALASVQSKQAGAARTSPVLRGNWVVETLLGEKLPRPPPDVPKLPEEESASNGLTMRQLVEKHTQIESCAVCHQRMDPFGFSFERYDSIGRLRDKESNGQPIDCHAMLKDGTQFEGIDGLRNYLLTKKRDVVVRLFCRRLLGYALGRSVSLSDQLLIDQMVAAVNRPDGRVSDAVLEIVRSPQFRSIRGSAYAEDE